MHVSVKMDNNQAGITAAPADARVGINSVPRLAPTRAKRYFNIVYNARLQSTAN